MLSNLGKMGNSIKMSQVLLESLEDGIATLTMNRPEALNALNAELIGELSASIVRLAQDPAAKVIVLTGAGRGFCAGGDVKSMDSGAFDDTLEEKVRSLRHRMEASRLLHETMKPTIASLRGPVAGAGMSLALACDFRVASETTGFTTAFARVGLSGDYGGSYFLSKLIGSAKARELYMLSDKVDAAKAEALGMVTKVVPDDQLESETKALATRLANGPSVTLSYIKKNMNAAESATLAEMFDLEAMHHSRCGMTEDHKEAARAFVEKRQPVFKGR